MTRTIVMLALTFPTAHAQPPPKSAPCPCGTSRTLGAWCDKHEAGYIANVKIESVDLFEWLDAHGHHIDPDKIECPDCKIAIRDNGYCERCKMGYVKREAYLSRLTYHIAKARPRKAAELKCLTCGNNARRFGWCDRCQVGMIGSVEIAGRQDYEKAAESFRILLIAVTAAPKCESCALAIVSDTTCRACSITYKNGKPVPAPAPAPSSPRR